jgi:uncharacterized protein
LLGFRGLGYSKEFVENMAHVQSKLFSGNCKIEIVSGEDDICAACPKLTDGRCGSIHTFRINSKDSAITSLISMPPGSITDAAAIYTAVAKVISVDGLSLLCSKCRWMPLGYCTEGLTSLIGQGELPKPVSVDCPTSVTAR